jgi:hypothetical protein
MMNQMTSPGSQSVLPDRWIDRLFQRFAEMYGKHWLDMWAGIAIDGVKATWAADLAGCSADQIRHALDHCRTRLKFPPTCPEFVSICREYRKTGQSVVYLPAPKTAMPPEIAEKLRAFIANAR